MLGVHFFDAFAFIVGVVSGREAARGEHFEERSEPVCGLCQAAECQKGYSTIVREVPAVIRVVYLSVTYCNFTLVDTLRTVFQPL